MRDEATTVGTREIVFRVFIAEDCEWDASLLGSLFFDTPDMVTDWEVEDEE